ncbi:MAG: GumC family protein [Bacteroidota bacterium]
MTEEGQKHQYYPQTPVNPGEHSAAVRDDEIDFRRLFFILMIHKWKFLVILILTMLVTYLYYRRQENYYESDFEVFYNETSRQFINSSGVPAVTPEFDKYFWLSVMQSDEVARLTLRYSSLPLAPEALKQMIRVTLGGQKDLTSPVFIVSIRSTASNQIPVIIKAYVNALNDMLRKYETESTNQTIRYLSGMLEENHRKLEEIDRDILYKQSSNPYLMRDIPKLTSDLESFRTELLNVQIELASVQSSKKETQREFTKLDGTVVNESAFSEPIKVQLMNLQVDLARALTHYKEDHPVVISLRDNIEKLSAMLRDSIEQKLEIKSLVSNPLKSQMMSKLLDLQISEMSLSTKVLSLQKVIGDLEYQLLPDSSKLDQRQLTRSRELVMMTITQLNSELIGIQSASQSGINRFVLIDEPAAPRNPSNKGLKYFVLIGLILGTFLGGIAVFLYDLADNRYMLTGDFTRKNDQLIIGTLPHRKRADKFYKTIDNGKESYKSRSELGELVVNVKQQLKKTGSKLIAVSSPARKEGKSLITLRLAAGLADKKTKVLLIDIDLYAPKLTYRLNMRKQLGLAEFLAGEKKEEEIIAETGVPGLHFIPAGDIDLLEEISYEDAGFERLMNWARANYDIVLVDTPAVLYVPDLISFLEHTDLIFAIARLNYTTERSFAKMVSMFRHGSHRIDGVILNDLRRNMRAEYGEYYYYYYDYQYGERTRKRKKKSDKKAA